MRTSFVAALGFVAALAPAVASAQGTPPPSEPAAATAPPPTYAPPPGQPAYTPPPGQPAYAPPPGQPGYAPVAVAEAPVTSAPKGLSLWGILPWNGFGVGGRFMLPVGIQPLLRSSGVRDNFALEFGADFTHWGYSSGAYSWSYNQIVPVAGLMWNIWLNSQFALYPKVELGYAIGWWSGWDASYGVQANHGWLFWDVTGGLLYKLQNGLTLRAEAGYAGLKLGVGWLF